MLWRLQEVQHLKAGHECRHVHANADIRDRFGANVLSKNFQNFKE